MPAPSGSCGRGPAPGTQPCADPSPRESAGWAGGRGRPQTHSAARGAGAAAQHKMFTRKWQTERAVPGAARGTKPRRTRRREAPGTPPAARHGDPHLTPRGRALPLPLSLGRAAEGPPQQNGRPTTRSRLQPANPAGSAAGAGGAAGRRKVLEGGRGRGIASPLRAHPLRCRPCLPRRRGLGCPAGPALP